MVKRFPSSCIAVIVGLLLSGCGQKTPTPPPTDSKPTTTTETPASKTPETKSAEVTPATKSTNAPSIGTPTARRPVAPFTQAEYLTEDIVGILVINPRQIAEWDIYKQIDRLIPSARKRELEEMPNPANIERIVVVFDQDFVNKLAARAGLGSDEAQGFEPEWPMPTVIFSLVQAADGEKILSPFYLNDIEEVDGMQVQIGTGETAAWESPDKKTIVLGTIETVLVSLEAKKAGKLIHSKLVSLLNTNADLSLAITFDAQMQLMEQATELAQGIPGLGLVQQIHGLAMQLNITEKPGSKMLEVTVATADEEAARQITELLTPLLQSGKERANEQISMLAETGDADNKPALVLAQRIYDSAEIVQSGSQVSFSVAVPDGINQLPEMVKPAIKKANEAAEAAQKRNDLRFLGLALHNYEAVFRRFPGAGKSADGEAGLSWRVHLLPFIEQSALYKEFNINEPWDSETNKPLIQKMPDLFKTNGVDEPGKTSFHVMTGKGAPFANDNAPEIREFTDGLSNTILVVEAGPDQAEIWTKPGGLDFDPKDPLKALGKLPGETFHVLLGDGAVKALSSKIDALQLRRMFQFADGEPLGGF